MKSCATCQFYHPEGEGVIGTCWRYPVHTRTRAVLSCGEHRGLPGRPAKESREKDGA